MAEFDPARFFMMGQQARLAEEQVKAARAERERQAVLPQARQQYFEGGDGQMLQQVAPEEWSQLETQRVARTKAEGDMEAAQADRARQQMLFQSKAIFAGMSEAARDPSKWPMAAERIEALGFAPKGSVPREAPPPDQMLSMLDQHRSVIETLSDPHVTPMLTNIMGRYGYGAGMEAAALRDQNVQRDIDIEMRSVREARGKPTTTVNVGGSSALTNSNVTEMQKKVFDARLQREQIGQIEKSISDMGGVDKLASAYEDIKSSVADKLIRSDIFAGFIPDNVKKQVGARAETIATMANVVNSIINTLYGANVPEGEMARARRSLPSEEDSGPVITAKISAMKKNIDLIERLGVDALREGILARKVTMAVPESSSPIGDSGGAQKAAIEITDGKQVGILPAGRPMPQGWRAK